MSVRLFTGAQHAGKGGPGCKEAEQGDGGCGDYYLPGTGVRN